MRWMNSHKGAVGIGILIREDSIGYCYAIIVKNGEELQVTQHQLESDKHDLKRLSDHPDVVLVIQGKGVVEKSTGQDGIKSFNPEKVYIQNNGNGQTAMFRKDRLGQILDDLWKLEIYPRKVFLGNRLCDYFVDFGVFQENGTGQVTIGDTSYSPSLKGALSGALSSYIPPTSIHIEPWSTIVDSHRRLNDKTIFLNSLKYASAVIGTGIFLGLVVWVILSTRESNLLESITVNRPQFAELKQLNTEISSKAAIIKEFNWARSSKLSYYLDRIATEIRKEITLIRWDSFIEHPGELYIEGSSEGSYSFHRWIENLKKQEFIERSSISFEYDEIDQHNTDKGSFTLRMKIK